MTENSLQGSLEDLVLKPLKDRLIKLVIARCIAALPFLGAWWANPILTLLVTKLITEVYDELDKDLTFALIDYKTGVENAAFTAASEALKKVQLDPSKTQEAIDHAKEEFKKRLADLVHIAH